MALGARCQELRCLGDRTQLEIHMQTLPGWRLNGGHTPSLSPSSSRDCPKWNLSRLQLDFISTRSCLLNIAQWLGRLRFLGFANLQESQAFKNQRGSSAASGSSCSKPKRRSRLPSHRSLQANLKEARPKHEVEELFSSLNTWNVLEAVQMFRSCPKVLIRFR